MNSAIQTVFTAFTRTHTLYRLLQQSLSVTRANLLRFSLCIFVQEKSLHSFYFVEFSCLEQIYSFTFISFTTRFIRHTCNFLSVFSLYFCRKNVGTVFIFCKFSLDQFYSISYMYNSFVAFTRAKFFKFALYFYGKIYLQFLFCVNLVIQTNFIVSHIQFIYIAFTTMFIRHTCNFLSFFSQYFYRKNFVQFSFCWQIQLFRPILLFHTCNSFISFLPQCLSVTRANFFKFLPLNFLYR